MRHPRWHPPGAAPPDPPEPGLRSLKVLVRPAPAERLRVVEFHGPLPPPRRPLGDEMTGVDAVRGSAIGTRRVALRDCPKRQHVGEVLCRARLAGLPENGGAVRSHCPEPLPARSGFADIDLMNEAASVLLAVPRHCGHVQEHRDCGASSLLTCFRSVELLVAL